MADSDIYPSFTQNIGFLKLAREFVFKNRFGEELPKCASLLRVSWKSVHQLSLWIVLKVCDKREQSGTSLLIFTRFSLHNPLLSSPILSPRLHTLHDCTPFSFILHSFPINVYYWLLTVKIAFLNIFTCPAVVQPNGVSWEIWVASSTSVLLLPSLSLSLISVSVVCKSRVQNIPTKMWSNVI